TVTVSEGTPLELEGLFTDAGLLDKHTVRLDWGDGSKSTTVLSVGARTFGGNAAFSHSYPNNSTSGPYVLMAEFWDDDQPAEPTTVKWNVSVADVAPAAVVVNAV
ncbi:MAG: hypothetical protein ACK5YO_38365, partial [Planctomyces sp.]